MELVLATGCHWGGAADLCCFVLFLFEWCHNNKAQIAIFDITFGIGRFCQYLLKRKTILHQKKKKEKDTSTFSNKTQTTAFIWHWYVRPACPSRQPADHLKAVLLIFLELSATQQVKILFRIKKMWRYCFSHCAIWRSKNINKNLLIVQKVATIKIVKNEMKIW